MPSHEYGSGFLVLGTPNFQEAVDLSDVQLLSEVGVTGFNNGRPYQRANRAETIIPRP